MPEIMTKYPSVVMDILKANGAKCNVGAKQQILTTCPPEQFCSLKSGELCVYDVKDAAQMTQIDTIDLFFSGWIHILIVGMLFGLGAYVGWTFKK
ncbi:MAG: hypothetical protein ACD_46C00219G0006 [uncultured bacterium]|nr:MAG: hypothetical protein ACD_46C00219G0006 [uncultured bacterium]